MRVANHVHGTMGLERTHVRSTGVRSREFEEADAMELLLWRKRDAGRRRLTAESSCLLYSYLAVNQRDGRVPILLGQVWAFTLFTSTCI